MGWNDHMHDGQEEGGADRDQGSSEFRVEVLQVSERAILVRGEHTDGEKVWTPKSQIIGYWPARGQKGMINVTRWIAQQKGWI